MSAKSMQTPSTPFPWALRGEELIPYSDLTIHMEAHAMRYALSVFEGVRTYTPKSGGMATPFALSRHLERMSRSLALTELPAVDMAELEYNICRLLKQIDSPSDGYLRIAVNATSSGTLSTKMVVTPCATLRPMGRKSWLRDNKRMRLDVGPRKPEGSLIPHSAKIIAHYAGGHSALVQSVRDGYDGVILRTHKGALAEAPTANLLIVRGKQLITPAIDQDILAGVTREVLLQVACDALGMEVVETEVSEEMLLGADEALLCGTGIEIAPIASIGRIQFPDDNPVTTSLIDAYFDHVRT